ncbi:MAG: C40 family peptidase [Chitinophagaceae bacterium]
MVKQILMAAGVVLFLSSCSSFKSLNFTNHKPVVTSTDPTVKNKFIENISVTPASKTVTTDTRREPEMAPTGAGGSGITTRAAAKKEAGEMSQMLAARTAEVESASPVQFKYSLLLDTEVESLPTLSLLDAVDDWYGVRYRSAGNTKSGVDCSGFTVAVYAAVYGMTLPRVSREQYRISRKISTTELQEGDLVFFNTSGRGVSHVGVYLGNNRFIHASVSRGVMVSNLFESYYLKRFVGAGRIDNKQVVVQN